MKKLIQSKGFVRSGRQEYGDGVLIGAIYFANNYGHYWASNAGDSNNSYYLRFGSVDPIATSGAYLRHRGYSLRCLAIE